LNTARAKLNTVGHNIANAGIHGFSRQATTAQAHQPLHLRDGRGMYGTGSRVTSIVQMRDSFIDRRFWAQQGILGRHSAKTPQLGLIETIFSDLSDSGVLSAFQGFFSRLQEISREAHDLTFRSNTIMAGDTLVNMVRNNAQALQQQQRDINGEIRAVVTEINSLGSQIASLNRQIHEFGFDGSNANDLRDQRALLVDRLSQLVNVEVREKDFSATSGIEHDLRFSVLINGYDFVNHRSHESLRLAPRPASERRSEFDVPGLYDITFANGSPFNIYSRNLGGMLRGLIDVRDGTAGVPTNLIFDGTLPPTFDASQRDTWPEGWRRVFPVSLPSGFDENDRDTWPRYPSSTYRGIPFYIDRLNNMVRTFAQAINDGVDSQNHLIPDSIGHRNGYDLDGNRGLNLFFTWYGVGGGTGNGCLIDGDIPILVERDPVTGLPTTTPPTPILDANGRHIFDYSRLNAFNMIMNPNLMADGGGRYLASASSPTIGESNNAVILGRDGTGGFIGLAQYPRLFREGRLIDFIIATSSHLAIDLQQSLRFEESYTEITIATENQRLSVSGVDMNEESLNMLRFQSLYQANARMIATMNQIYDTLINRLGI